MQGLPEKASEGKPDQTQSTAETVTLLVKEQSDWRGRCTVHARPSQEDERSEVWLDKGYCWGGSIDVTSE